MRRAIFLDRDGVINRSIVKDGKPYAPLTMEEFEIIPGVADALDRLRGAGFLNVVVTNQPDIASGKQRPETLEAMHSLLRKRLAIDGIKVCPHVEADACQCRKPKPGLLLEAAHELDIDLGLSHMVGDRWRDIAAGQQAGCQCYFIDYGYKEKLPNKPYVAVESLLSVADLLLSRPSLNTPF
jgi:D-glycero-D-manno-heptose 1,7-bisphosphate phosphatase